MPNRPQLTSFITSTSGQTGNNCIACNVGSKHPLHACSKFKAFSHENKLTLLKNSKLCFNCLRPGHFVKMCKSNQHCKACRRPHHTLLHVELTESVPDQSNRINPNRTVQSHAATELSNSTLLMTCRVLIHGPSDLSVEARAVLDFASSNSFISERIAQILCLPRSHRSSNISGIGGLTCKSGIRAVTQFAVPPILRPDKWFKVSAIIMPRVTCDLPVSPVNNNGWDHLSDLSLADTSFSQPGRIDVLLGVDIFVNVLLQGRRIGPPGAPVALNTEFGWVLAGGNELSNHNVVHHVVTVSGDGLIQRFWEVEEHQSTDLALTPDERFVMDHFKAHHSRDDDGRFIVPLPRITNLPLLGESRSSAVRRYLSLEHSLDSKGKSEEFHDVMEEYLKLGHAELVPVADLQKPDYESFYLPMHVVLKELSTTTKVHAVFDTSAKSSLGFFLNDNLLVGPTVHSSLVDVLLGFRHHRYTLTTDVSKMYRAIKLTQSDRDYHRFVWRRNRTESLMDY